MPLARTGRLWSWRMEMASLPLILCDALMLVFSFFLHMFYKPYALSYSLVISIWCSLIKVYLHYSAYTLSSTLRYMTVKMRVHFVSYFKGANAYFGVSFLFPQRQVESPSGVFQSATSNGEGDGPALRGQQQNGFSEAAPRTTTFNSPLLTSLFSGGGFGGINSQRPTTSVTGVTGTNPSSDTALSSSRNNNMWVQFVVIIINYY